MKLRIDPGFLLSLLLMACASALAKPGFYASDVAGKSSECVFCDVDGDGLQDLVLMDDLDLSVFYQDINLRFTSAPRQSYRLEHRPCVVWAAKLGGRASSLLVMTGDGVSELRFTDRTNPPAIVQIIRQPTIVPYSAEGTNAISLSLSAETGQNWPLLLVPSSDGLEVWEHREGWRRAQIIGHAIDSNLRPSVANPGYSMSLGFNLCMGDADGDGKDDLIVRSSGAGLTNTYRLYSIETNGLFAPEPALTFADKAEPHSWLCWTDLNRDGKVDLIKSVWLDEPSLLPGIPSGKVLVRIYMAGQQGPIPTEPQQVFRKSDWTPALPIVDVDGDGFPDLVLGYSHVDSRDGLRKQIIAKQLDYSLGFHFWRAETGFPKEADCRRDVVIHLEQATLLLGSSPHEYFESSVKLDGDFNGDGKTDLMVRDQSEGISVYFFISRAKGFSSKPDVRFNCPALIDGWEVKDLNGDGVSDLIVKLDGQKGYRIFISRILKL